MQRSSKGQFVREGRPKGFMSSKEALLQEIADAGRELTKNVNVKLVEALEGGVINAKRIYTNADQIHKSESTNTTLQLRNKAWMQWRDAERKLELARKGELSQSDFFKLAGVC